MAFVDPSDVLFDSFRSAGVRAALNRYAEFAVAAGWSIPHKISLWNAGTVAADASLQIERRQQGASEIYDSLVSWWKVFRPS